MVSLETIQKALTLATTAIVFAAPSAQFSGLEVKQRAILSQPTLVHQFSNPTWIENIFSRSNGDLLVTIIGQSELRVIHPFDNPSTASLVHHFDGYDAVMGITEVAHDNFVVSTGNYSFVTGTTPGSWSIWNVEFPACNQTDVVKVDKVTDVPAAQIQNGMATLNDHAVLTADSFSGSVFKVDLRTKSAEVVIQDASMAPVTNGPASLGINGLKVLDGFLYYTNSAQQSIFRVQIDGETGKATGPVEKLASLPFPDDFALLDDGTSYVPQAYADTVVRVLPDGEVSTIAGALNSSVVPGGTSATLGRTYRDLSVLYVCDQGSLGSPINGTYTEGGKVVAIQL